MTQTEWVALISVAGTMTSGGLGSFATYWITRRSINENAEEGKRLREHDSYERELDRHHQTSLNDSVRRQQRRLDAYIALQSLVNITHDFAKAHRVGISIEQVDSNVAIPEIPDSTQSLAQLVASEAVVESMNLLTASVLALKSKINDAWFWHSEAQKKVPGALETFRESNSEVQSAARCVIEVAGAVHRAMRRELLEESAASR